MSDMHLIALKNSCTMMDEQALVRGLLSEQTKVMGYIKSIVRRQELAKDIFQEVCVLALQKRKEIADETHLKKWMRVTARFYSMRSIRRRHESHLSLDYDVADLMDQKWSQIDLINRSQLSDALNTCIGTLSPANREMLERRFVANCDYDRLAREMNRSVNSLYTAFSRIYAFLSRCITEKLSPQPR